MCCGRSHYPKETGAWRTDSEAHHIHLDGGDVQGLAGCMEEHDHLHIVLPVRVKGTPTFCTQIDRSTFSVGAMASIFDSTTIDARSSQDGARVYLPENSSVESLISLRDVLAIAVSEGGEYTPDWLEEFVKEYQESREVELRLMWSARDAAKWGEPFVPDYHEWLIQQAQKELTEKRKEEHFVEVDTRRHH